ncbi:MAG: purine-nucleoside phosphorylase [Bradymonadales bacterium]|nr:MAG: purine-nucleoside phosphorylase [Bradymonadales bacterium]
MNTNFQRSQEFLSRELKEAPELSIVLGSGLSAYADELKIESKISYAEIPGMEASSVIGHRGELITGKIDGLRVCILSGRLHGYEGHSPDRVVYLARLLCLWGCRQFVLTNASGSTHLGFNAGDLALISDHINFTGQNPLVGKELYGGERFPDMSDLYSQDWRKRILARSKRFREAVYAGVLGPSFETAAEIQMLHRMGADLVGMSTVWEAIALKQMGAQVLGISCVANLGTGVKESPLSHQEVLDSMASSYRFFSQEMKTVLETRPQ